MVPGAVRGEGGPGATGVVVFARQRGWVPCVCGKVGESRFLKLWLAVGR